ncbi:MULTISPECIES: hypothetical protein [Bacillus cereus group]|uniref:hypothetical protein n=1 Tax=Bacillus cereus group TaxID=86661 RepID=UPI0011CBEAFB|nr:MULTISPECIES: hypothetical protein [Bacillus cereus group]QWG81954.1 hypothetical protein EXW27_31520 [Bacillus mycoides]TXR76663.1 hypothetical protein DN408_20795 [Bacillus sp. AR13-1]
MKQYFIRSIGDWRENQKSNWIKNNYETMKDHPWFIDIEDTELMKSAKHFVEMGVMHPYFNRV